MKVSCPFGNCLDQPHIQFPFASKPTYNRSTHHTSVEKIHHPSSTVPPHKPVPLFPHPQFLLFCKSQLTSPGHHNFAILLPIVSTCQFVAIRETNFTSLQNRIRASAMGAVRHIHNAIISCHLQNSRLDILVLA